MGRESLKVGPTAGHPRVAVGGFTVNAVGGGAEAKTRGAGAGDGTENSEREFESLLRKARNCLKSACEFGVAPTTLDSPDKSALHVSEIAD